MALLNGVKPETVGNYLEPGIYRVISGQVSMAFESTGTQYIQQTYKCVDTGLGIRKRHYITSKTIGYFAGFCQSLGLDAQARATIDTDRPETMQGMVNKILWIKVNNNNKGYGEIKNHAPDGDRPNWAEPVASAPASSTGSQAKEAMPWDNNSNSEPEPTPPPPEDDINF